MKTNFHEPEFIPEKMDGFTIRDAYAYARKVPPDIKQRKN